MGDLSKNLSRHEFSCHCCCDQGEISPRLVAVLQQIRDQIAAPIEIASGLRCPDHNRLVGGSPNSGHLTGEAVDILCLDSRHREALVRLAQQGGIRRIGIAPGFVHLDIAESPLHPQNVLWLYGQQS